MALLAHSSVLTISATEYFQMENKKPGDYRPVGVHGECGFLQKPEMNISEHIPEGTEVVVGYRSHVLHEDQPLHGGPPKSRHHYYGTALVNRKKESELKLQSKQ